MEQHRILIIDDEEDLCWALSSALRPVSRDVTSINTGAEALALLETNEYAVVFIDAKLPDLDGLALVDRIIQNHRRTSIIMISGYYYQEDQTITDGLKANQFVGFIAKPFKIDEVRWLTRQAIERSVEAGKWII